MVYSFYLNFSRGGQYFPDFVTELVATQCNEVINSFTDARIMPHETEPSMKLYVKGQFVARIIEGCNSISLIILFVSFIVAFAQKLSKTLLFVFVGSVLIYTVNIARIVFLAWALYTFPEYQHLLHGVVFPGLIYGMIFLLWMLWVRMLNQTKPVTHV